MTGNFVICEMDAFISVVLIKTEKHPLLGNYLVPYDVCRYKRVVAQTEVVIAEFTCS